MSYFLGGAAAATNSDSFVEKRGRRRHSKQRVSQGGSELEPVHHGSKHRRRHLSRGKSAATARSKDVSGTRGTSDLKVAAGDDDDDDDDKNGEDHKSSSPKNKSRRHLRREIERLVVENRLLTSRLEGSNTDTGNIEELREKDEIIAKIRNKYHKLEKSYKEVHEEREKLSILIQQKDFEYRKLHIHHEELTQSMKNSEKERINLHAINQKLKNENVQYHEDVTLLKNLVYRLNVELEKYQDKLRQNGQDVVPINNNAEDSDVVLENKKIFESWGRVHFHALGPLLNAYQENIREKEELVQKYGCELETFTGKLKEIVEENEGLRTEVDVLKKKCEKYTEDLKTMNADATLIKEQNDLLMKQVNLQKQKLQDIHAVYEKKVETMSQDNNKLHKDYLACKTELSNLQGKYEILNEGYEKLKNNSDKTMPVSVHMAAVDECKRLFEELKFQYDAEKKKLNSRIKLLEESQPENEKQLITVTAERNQLKTLSRNLEKNLKKTQQKLQYFQNTNYSMRISRNSFKRQLNKTTTYCEELVTEHEKLLMEREKLIALLKEREKENESMQFLGDNITQRMGNLKSQLKSVQKGAKEQLATVEKHIKIQESDVDRMKAEYQRELQRLKQLIRQKEDVIGRLQREKCATQDNLELVWKVATSDDQKVKDVLKNSKV